MSLWNISDTGSETTYLKSSLRKGFGGVGWGGVICGCKYSEVKGKRIKVQIHIPKRVIFWRSRGSGSLRSLRAWRLRAKWMENGGR